MRLFKRQGRGGDSWYAQWYDIDGRRQQRCTRHTDKSAAEALARIWERESADPAYATASKATLNEILSLMLARGAELVKAGKRSDATVKVHRIRAGHWVRIFGHDFKMARFSAADVDRFISQRRSEDAAEHTIKKDLDVLRVALRVALRAGLWTGQIDRVMPVAFSAEYTPRTRWLPREELNALFGELLPDRAARVAWIVGTSSEWGATERARRADVTMAADGTVYVLIRGTKNAKRWRTVPIVLYMQQELMVYALQYAEGTDGAMFRPWARGSYIRDLRTACRRAGIEPATPNDLRRSFAHWLKARRVSNQIIAPMMGHADTVMVERVYGKLGPSELARALEGPKPSVQLEGQQSVQLCSAGAADGLDALDALDGFCQPAGDLPEEITEEVARDTGFEPVTFGSGGHNPPDAVSRILESLPLVDEYRAPKLSRRAAPVQLARTQNPPLRSVS